MRRSVGCTPKRAPTPPPLLTQCPRCGIDQVCQIYCCSDCGRKFYHQQVCVMHKDGDVIIEYWFKDCVCGAHKWLTLCEAA